MKIAYIILHYIATKDTLECVESILKISEKSKHEVQLIVVDNGSENNSYKDLCEKLHDKENVIVLHSEKNLGFSKGNNIGFKYAKRYLNADFIVLLNNDTIISQSDFNEILVKKYEEKRYAILGPDIVTLDNCHQNPGKKQSWSFLELLFFRIKKYIKLFLSYFPIESLKQMSKEKTNTYSTETISGDVEKTILHGACMIFSPEYIRRFEGLYDKTFLYWEEDILKLQADVYGYLMLYSSDLQILHKEDVSTNMLQGTAYEKDRRKYRRLIQSAGIYRNLKIKLYCKKQVISLISKVARNSKGKNEYNIDPETPISYLLILVFKRAIMLMCGMIKLLGVEKRGKIVFIGKNVKLLCKNKMHIGTGVTIQDGVYIDALSREGVHFGNGCSIGSSSIIRCSGNMKELGVGFEMGNNSSLADNCFVGATGGVWIGENVIGGQNIRFHASNHNYKSTDKLIKNQGITAKGIHIGDNCWIGAGVVFCDGVSIGSGCVIGANAVITKSFPANSIIAGVPAKVIGVRSEA